MNIKRSRATAAATVFRATTAEAKEAQVKSEQACSI